MQNIEKETLENLIDFLHCNESSETFKRKRYFLFNFAILWNLFEDKCMNNFAQILEEVGAVEKKPEVMGKNIFMIMVPVKK